MAVDKPNLNYEHVYAIIRVERGGVGQLGELNPHLITITKAFRSKEKAESEVERLSRVNSDKRCTYFSRLARLERPDQ